MKQSISPMVWNALSDDEKWKRLVELSYANTSLPLEAPDEKYIEISARLGVPLPNKNGSFPKRYVYPPNS